MSLIEKTTQEELILYEILRNPALCIEFIYSLDKLDYEEKIELTYYQKEFVCDFNPYVSLVCARAVGKSFALSGMVIWLLINNVFQNDYVVYIVPSKVHLEPVWSHLLRFFRSNSFLKYFIDARGGFNSSEFSIRLLNNSQLLCRIAGQTGTGANVIGLHTPFVMLDEAGYFPWGTWIEMQPILNTFTNGSRLVVSGVPTGLRENNVAYFVDMESSSYTKHRISAFENPRFSDADAERAKDQYGGTESDDYVHLVLGKHGRPVFALFDRNMMEISNYECYKLVLDGTRYFDNLIEYINRLSPFPGLPDRDTKCFFGVDLGYTEPTIIVIFYLDNYKRIKIHGRVRLEKVNYFIQEKIVDWLDTKFRPFIIGMDEGSAGKAVIPRLQEHDEFIHKDYRKRLIPINFSSQIVLGIDSEGNEIKSKTKPFSVGVLQDYTNNHKIIYTSTDLEMITELEKMTYTKTPTGDIVYRTLTDRGGKKGEDHITSALLCGSLAYYLNSESLDFTRRNRKLIKPSWFLG